MTSILDRLSLVLPIDKNRNYGPAEIEDLRLQAFNKLKSAFSSGPQRDSSYTQRTTSYVDLMTVDFHIDPKDLEA